MSASPWSSVNVWGPMGRGLSVPYDGDALDRAGLCGTCRLIIKDSYIALTEVKPCRTIGCVRPKNKVMEIQ
jgi:hypothetical protein